MTPEMLAIDGGRPVRAGPPIPLSRVSWDATEQQAVERVFRSGLFCSVYAEAQETRALEAEFAARVGARYAVAFNSGTTAQHAALAALGIGPGDEVIVPPLTFISTAYTVLIAGAVPVFADVQRATICIDPDAIRRQITPRTRAIVPVHWFGLPAPMPEIMSIAQQHNLYVIEDCAHGPGIALDGRPAGSFGQIATWSLQQTKMLTAAGEGGLATTNDPALAARLRQICDHGKAQGGVKAPTDFIRPYRITALGNNYRLSEIQSAFARAQLAKLDRFAAARRKAYEEMRAGLAGIPGLEFQEIRAGAQLSYIYFPVLFSREAFSAPLERIVAALHYEGVAVHPIAVDELCHVHPLFTEPASRATAVAFRLHGDPLPAYGWGTQPTAEKIAGELLCLPLYPDLSAQDVADIVAATRKVAGAYRR